VAGVGRGRELGHEGGGFLYFIPHAPKSPLPCPLLTPATQANSAFVQSPWYPSVPYTPGHHPPNKILDMVGFMSAGFNFIY